MKRGGAWGPPPRLGTWLLRRTLPKGIPGESTMGDLEQEYRSLCASAGGRSPRVWYFKEALKLGFRYGALRSSAALFRLGGGGGTPSSRMGPLERLFQEVGHGLRILSRSPGLALFAVVAMGLGIGATATMFSVSHGLLREQPYPEADRLVYVGWLRPGDPGSRIDLTAWELREWRESQSVLETLSAVKMEGMDLAGARGPAERVSGARVTVDAFETLRVRPALGRGFLPGEGEGTGPEVVILSDGLWSRRFGRDPAVLGGTLRVNGVERTVVGIMPEGFRFPELEDVWIPLQVAPAGMGEGPRGHRSFGRLREGVTMDEARAELGTLARRLALARPETYEVYESRVTPYHEYYVGRDAVIIMNTLVVIASFVLLIACASVANLLLARAAGRSRELGVRSAMGASRGRVMSQLLGESLVIAGLGGILGALVAWGGAALFHRGVADLLPFFWMSCRVDGAVLLFVALLVAVAGLLAGVAPALRASRAGAAAVLRDGDRGASSLSLGRLSRVLVVAEVTLSFGLLTTAGMMAEGPIVHGRRDPGFDGNELLTAQIRLRREQYPAAGEWDRFYREVLGRLKAMPGVQAAAFSSSPPGLGAAMTRFQLQGVAYDREEDLPRARISMVTAEFFSAFEAEAVEGRLFDERDVADGERVAIVNRSFAQRFFPGGSPLGRPIRVGGLDSEDPWVTVVGVAPDLRMNGQGPDLPEGIILPLWQRPQPSVHLLLHATGNPRDLIPRVRNLVAELDPDLPVSQPRTVQAAMADDTRAELVFFMLLLVCGSIALLLAAVGLFGVLAFTVRQRTREIGIRIALGAEVRNVLMGTLKSGLIQVVSGLGMGVLLALALSPLVRGLFYAEQILDWRVYGLVGAMMLVTGFVASLVPAARAVRIDPAEALRRE